MRLMTAGVVAAFGLVVFPATVLSSQPDQLDRPLQSISVPRVISIGGEFRPADGSAALPMETVSFRIYSTEKGGVPLWEETQTVPVDPSGFYKVLLGATEADGVPVDVFVSGEARWLSTTWLRAGEAEGPRTRLTSVPYALRAADAETLGGLPASAYQLAFAPGAGASAATGGAGASAATSGATGRAEGRAGVAGTQADSAASAVPKAVSVGTLNRMAKYVNSVDVGDSTVYEKDGLVGFNTTAPLDVIHSRFINGDGTLTGLAVQNLGGTAGSYSGMLFYDQNGALGQFQGFNNATHEYRINNIASSGSINFMLGGTSRLKMDPSGRVLVGTTTPDTGFFVGGVLEARKPVSSSLSGLFARKVDSDTFSAAIHARSDTGFSGVLIKAMVGVPDNTDHGGNAALLGSNSSTNGVGVQGRSASGIGVQAQGGSGVGITASGTTAAGQFTGNVTVSGTLTKGGGAFQIDHPLDPANKYLMHSFVESPDMMNVYNGNVLLDSQGQATVLMPDWFEALNRDFRYQLTSIGAPAPYLHVAEKLVAGQFRIAGGAPNGEVSWQVTGIRQDAWANANRIPTEVLKKGSEKGRFLHPSVLGQPKGMAINAVDDGEMTRIQSSNSQ
jgi:hypothetical protein